MVVVKSNTRYYFHITLTFWTSLTCFAIIILGSYMTYQYNSTSRQLIPIVSIVGPNFSVAQVYSIANTFSSDFNVHSQRRGAQILAFYT